MPPPPQKSGGKWKIVLAVVAVVLVIVAISSQGDDSTTDAGSETSSETDDGTGDQPAPTKKAKPEMTAAQENAITAAKNYLEIGQGFSRYGLIKQLTAEVGSGFKRADAVFAVNHLKPDWNKQAVLAAKNYLDIGMGFSRDGLIKQLTAKVGSGFTMAQAEYAANKVGL